MAIIFTLHVGFADANGDCTNATENKGLLFTALNSAGLDGYTVLDGVGCYNGKHEPGASVVVIALDSFHAQSIRQKVREAALRYKDLASQAEVWLTQREETLEIL